MEFGPLPYSVGGILRQTWVFHAVPNVGHVDACFTNHPTRAYNQAQPDKYRLPLDTPLIPFNFAPTLGVGFTASHG